ncbi:Uncharacterised protein [Cardiobacterium valvarum]|uniref:Uncharacterized protein n=1 Tax=Cardiobacterium valvarum TaxID=194702 RepID=A0A381DZL9_9GAMM|nr:Uncharacterised protein [Cardiobacterium valvarum]
MRFLAPYQNLILSLVRIVCADLFILHGTSKVFAFPDASVAAYFRWHSIFDVAAALELFGGHCSCSAFSPAPSPSSFPGKWRLPTSSSTPRRMPSSRC